MPDWDTFLTICLITNKQLNEQTRRDSLSAADFHLDPNICVEVSFNSHDSAADCTESTLTFILPAGPVHLTYRPHPPILQLYANTRLAQAFQRACLSSLLSITSTGPNGEASHFSLTLTTFLFICVHYLKGKYFKATSRYKFDNSERVTR